MTLIMTMHNTPQSNRNQPKHIKSADVFYWITKTFTKPFFPKYPLDKKLAHVSVQK